MRQIVLDTETTGLEVFQDHRIIEIGCVELVSRKLTGNHYHQYLNPGRDVDEGAFAVHGVSNEFLQGKPVFAQIADEFLAFVSGAELIIHNAPFDVGFLNHELAKLAGRYGSIEDYCTIIDSLAMARKRHPGQKNNLDALCKRYAVDNSQRQLHGALLDAEILADVYLAMSGGQVSMSLGHESDTGANRRESVIHLSMTDRPPLKIITASPDEVAEHHRIMAAIGKASGIENNWH